MDISSDLKFLFKFLEILYWAEYCHITKAMTTNVMPILAMNLTIMI